MDALIASFRRGRHTMTPNQFLLQADGIDSKAKASALIGKSVVWKSKAGKEIHGKITSVHGNSGTVRARFTKGLPGTAIGDRVSVR